MTSTTLKSKYKVILIDISHKLLPPKEVGVVEGTWKEIDQYANKKVDEFGYSTWTITESKARKGVIKL
jgi:hypothetical protein